MGTADENPCKDLIPLIIKGVGEKYGNLYVQNQIAFVKMAKLFGGQNDRNVAREWVIWNQERDEPRASPISRTCGHNRIQAQRNGCRILDSEENFESILVATVQFVPPVDYIYPLPRASLLDANLIFKMLGLRSDLSGLPQEDADSPQGNQDSNNRKYQVGTIKRIFSGIVGRLFIGLGGWLCLYGAVVAKNLWGFCGILFLALLTLLAASVLCDTSVFGGWDALRRLRHSYTDG